eukprot:1757890-Pleurochrysis_carterae.AAC.2
MDVSAHAPLESAQKWPRPASRRSTVCLFSESSCFGTVELRSMLAAQLLFGPPAPRCSSITSCCVSVASRPHVHTTPLPLVTYA